MKMFHCMCMLQILPRILIQTVLQKTEYGVTLDILSALDLNTNILSTFITLTCIRIFLKFTNLMVQVAVTELVNNSFSFCAQYSVVLPCSFILLLLEWTLDKDILKVPLSFESWSNNKYHKKCEAFIKISHGRSSATQRKIWHIKYNGRITLNTQ